VDVTEKTFHNADPSTQNWILFDSLKQLNSKLDNMDSKCNDKHTVLDSKIKKSARINKGLSAGSKRGDPCFLF
jgi:hypothetical protein